MTVKRGKLYYADLSPVVGSEQGGVRPVLIIQNDMGNCHSPTVICAAITSKMNKILSVVIVSYVLMHVLVMQYVMIQILENHMIQLHVVST